MTEPTQLENGDEFKILPHGVKFYQTDRVKSLLGNGVVIDPNTLLSDFKLMRKSNIKINGSMVISDRSSLVTSLHRRVAQRLQEVHNKAFEDDELWLHGECITQAFKPIKMALRVSHLVDDWNEFQDKY